MQIREISTEGKVEMYVIYTLSGNNLDFAFVDLRDNKGLEFFSCFPLPISCWVSFFGI